ncbi:hypothetical protein C8R47DRAFT_136108 [Mycena vitilis]|nr:hypothetical protein C8R47DRAFT_136108 [Mycena vitilis]
MESALGQIRELVWKRILFFAMCVEERRWFNRTEPTPSRLPILLVSKYISRLALPYMFDCLRCSDLDLLASQLRSRPELGSCIRSIFWPHRGFASHSMLIIISCATNLQMMSTTVDMSLEHLDVLTKIAGSSLRELKTGISPMQIPASVFARLQELRVLELNCSSVTFTSDPTLQEGLNKLHTLRFQYIPPSFSLLQALSTLSLESLRTLQFDNYVNREAREALIPFLNAHGKTLLHLKITLDPDNHQNLKLFDVCGELIDIEFIGSVPSTVFTCTTPHTSLTKVIMSTTDSLVVPAGFDPAMFPALREIRIAMLRWPKTEREISKSEWVPIAEAWLKHGIKVTDLVGQHWIPRVKRSRGQ